MMFAQKLQKIMKEKNLTTYKIQKATGISQGNVDSWLKGRSKPRALNLNKLCVFLDVPLEYFTKDPPKDSENALHRRITKAKAATLRAQICNLVNTSVAANDLILLERIVKSFSSDVNMTK